MSFLDFDLSNTELMCEMQFFDDERHGDVTHEYFYKDKDHEGKYILHFVPGTINEKMIKQSHYLFFECGEGVYYMDEFEFHVFAESAEKKAKSHPMNCKFINYELYKKIEAWNC